MQYPREHPLCYCGGPHRDGGRVPLHAVQGGQFADHQDLVPVDRHGRLTGEPVGGQPPGEPARCVGGVRDLGATATSPRAAEPGTESGTASPSGAAAHNATASGAPSSGGAKTSADRAIYFARDEAYPEQLWWLVAAFIGLVAVCQFAAWVLSKWSRARRLAQRKNAQKTNPGGAAEGGGSPSAAGRGFALRNVPTAVVNAYRVVAFRWTLEIGQSYTLNLAEVFVTVAYIVALFSWEFLGSESQSCSSASVRRGACLPVLTHLPPSLSATDLAGVKLDIKYWGTRAGILAVSQTPIITALGTKNNIVACESEPSPPVPAQL